jgi:hypothetical protein
MSEIPFVSVSCPHEGCGAIYMIPQSLKDRMKITHECIYCPLGHSWYYPAKSDEEILKAELEQKKIECSQMQSRLAQKIAAESSCNSEKEELKKQLISQKGVNGNLKKRIKELKEEKK